MPTAVWTGSLSLGLVVVPVRLYPAIQKKTVRFHELDCGGRRMRHVRVSEPEVEYEPMDRGPSPRRLDRTSGPKPDSPPRQEPREQTSPGFVTPRPKLAFEEIRKGFEVAPGQYVSMTSQEVVALAPERSRVIDVQQFVDVAAVDPIPAFNPLLYTVDAQRSLFANHVSDASVLKGNLAAGVLAVAAVFAAARSFSRAVA